VQLATHKLHVAETYVTKAGLARIPRRGNDGVRDLKGSVSILHERIDRLIEAAKTVRNRRQGP